MLIKERVEELVEFYAPFLNNAKEFIIDCHRQTEEKKNAWVMLNQTQRLIYLADNADKIKQSRDAFKVLFLIICAEAIAKLYKNFEKEEKSKPYVKIFFREICSPEYFNSLNGAIITDKPKSPTALSPSEVVDLLYTVRCSVVHEGRYWEFSFKDESKLDPFSRCYFAKTEATIVVSITYQKLRNIIVEGAIRAIKMYLSDKSREINSSYTLGPLPWKEDDLKVAYFSDFLKTRKAIQEHPGFLRYQALESIRFSLDIFLDSISDLMKSINFFIEESNEPGFWARAKKEQFAKLGLNIRRGVFSTVTSAKALVDNSRNISEKITIPDYQLRINNTFENSEEHRFIQDLRNFISHFRMIEVDWEVSWSKEGKRTQFLLLPEKLLSGDGWTSLANKYIQQSPKGIDIKTLFENYKTRVEEFHCWFHAEIERLSLPGLDEYREYERLINKFGSKSLWDIIFYQIMPNKKINPYEYLDQYLTKPELDEVMSLPINSQSQVDRIIEIMDEYGVCDVDLRRLIYAAFNVK